MNTSDNFSSLKRDNLIHSINTSIYDVLIIGGGITGAGIALDAASRGFKTVLIEQNDFASGTSSRSTKLVHGGLRYLEKFQFKFVAQLGRERKILHDNITHNVLPTPVILPIVKGGSLNKTLTYIALKIYDILAGVKKEYQTYFISKNVLLQKYPLFESKGLKGAFMYYEYKTNDGRLVIETLKKAVEYGAISLNYMQLTELTKQNGKITGAAVTDSITGHKFTISAKQTVNATGAWSEVVMKTFDSQIKPSLKDFYKQNNHSKIKTLLNIKQFLFFNQFEKELYPTKGIHIVVVKERFPLKEAFYFDTHDGRMIFAIPRQNHVYIGTTDTPYIDDLRHPIADNDDVEYLLKAVNLKFSGINLIKNDVVSCWAGIRPLIRNREKKPGEISRREELFVSQSGLITITGGKLTGYRLMAKRVVDMIPRDDNFVKCFTHKIRACGSNWENPPTLHELVEIADHKYDEAKQTGISMADFKRLFYRYGTEIDLITEKAYEYLNQMQNIEHIWIKAELWYAVNFEMVTNMSDFCIYRSEMVLFETEKLKKHLHFIAKCLCEFLQWDNIQKEQLVNSFMEQWGEYKIIDN